MSDEEIVCPECGEPVGMTAAYCMHCSADLTEGATSSTTADDERWTSGTSDDKASAGTAGEAAIEGNQSGTHSGSTASPGDLPPELQSNGGSLETPRLVPEHFLLKAIGTVLSIAVSFSLGFASAVALSSLIANDLAFIVGLLVWFGAAAACFRLAPF